MPTKKYLLIDWQTTRLWKLTDEQEALQHLEDINSGDKDVLLIEATTDKLEIRRLLVGNVEDKDGDPTDDLEISDYELLA